MIHIKSLILSLILSLFVTVINAQIGIGNTNPQGALDITDTNNGLLIPRVALVNLATVTVITPTESELVYNTANVNDVTPGYYYLSTATGPWVRIGGATGWLTTGNADIVNGTNFMGTTNNVDVAFRRNNLAAGRLSLSSTSYGVGALNLNTGIRNVALGVDALRINTSGEDNVAIGYHSLYSNTNSLRNVAIGYRALASLNNSASTNNVAVGYQAMEIGNGNFSGNSFFGSIAGRSNTGNFNTGIGAGTLSRGTSAGQFNTAVGYLALEDISSGQQNTGIGVDAFYRTTTGSFNTGLGYRAGGNNVSGTNNTIVGYQAGAEMNNTGSQNVLIGRQAGFRAGSGNIIIGNEAGFADNGSNKLYIHNANASADASLIYGEFNNNILRTNGQFQIGNPAGTGYQFPVARGTNNQVLQTNATGVLNWVDTSSLDITEVDPQISSATINAVPKWNGTTLVDGIITDDGTNVTISGNTTTSNFQMTSGANANYILQSDAAGNATWVENPLATLSIARSNLSANQPLNDLGWQKILFDTVVFDTNGEFNTTDNSFVASTAGYYQINAGFHTNDQSNGQFYSVGVYVNGTLYQETTGNHISNGPVSRNINCIVNLAAGDFVEIFVLNFQTGVQIESSSGKTFFEVQQIR
ncbi:hypothetical protein [Paucihalobacter sp.]|uniref:hypothetical protein n=1 Tax=Paucihalobacter sp. TaxID=2850405 RepID=UPI002FDFE157